MLSHDSYTRQQLVKRVEYLEENRRYIHSALETALSISDFPSDLHAPTGPEDIVNEASKRIGELISFEAKALYLVNEEGADFRLLQCVPQECETSLKAEVNWMIDKGFFAWALRERRGVTISSRDQSREILFHVIATYSRIRGMLVGILPGPNATIPDTSRTLLSILLRNTANALESHELYKMMRNQNQILETKVAEKSRELARSERQLRQALKMQAIGTLAGGIAHDFNNILFPIIGYTELALEDVPNASLTAKNLEEVLKASQRARELVQQILTFSRQHDHPLKPVRIQSVVKEALGFLKASLPPTITIKHSITDDLEPVMADPTQIHQVLMNLCTNAYHAMEENGGTLEVTLVEVFLGADTAVGQMGLRPGRYLRLSVADTGSGMPPEVMERIFEPYFTTKSKEKGTGLGLSVVHGLVKSHGGDIRVASQPGKGSHFDVLLPVVEPEEEEIGKVSEPDSVAGNERILLVDDEEQNATVLQQLLERLGYSVTAYTDSIQALEAFRSEPARYDLLIADLTMPGLNGEQLIRAVRQLDADMPIVLCTGFSESLSTEKAEALGVCSVLMKPVVRKELAAAVRRALGRGPDDRGA
jgi:signal transduction histidine kinase/ActR/RegA family two-component response regulator